MVWWMAVPAAAGRIYKGGKWVKEIIKAKKAKSTVKKPKWEKEIDRDLNRIALLSTAPLLPGVGNEYEKRKRLKKLKKNRRGTQTTKAVQKKEGY